MKKQKKQTLLTAIIVILLIILIVMIGSIVYEEMINMNKQNIQDTIVPEVDEEYDILPEEEEISTEENEEVIEENNEYLGEEEQQPENENVEQDLPKSKDEKAIELAKNEWGDDDTVTFSVEKKKDTKYYVAVKSAATVLQWYEVDTETWEISEY